MDCIVKFSVVELTSIFQSYIMYLEMIKVVKMIRTTGNDGNKLVS